MTPTRIRRATAEDAAQFNTIIGDDALADQWASLATNQSLSFIAETETGEPCGFLEARHAGDDAEILMLATHQDHQRQGVAIRLLAALINIVEKHNCTRIVLEVAEDNHAARALYDKSGFHEVARRNGYYKRSGTAPAADALLLARHFASAKNALASPGNSVPTSE